MKTLETALRILDGHLKTGSKGSEPPAGMTPLDVMVEAMRTAYQLGGAMAAFPYAKEAAPYMHPRMATVEWKDPNGKQGVQVGRFTVEFVRPAQAANDQIASPAQSAAN